MAHAPDPRRRLLLAAGLTLLAGRAVAADGPRPLEMGVIPYLTTAKLIAGYQPLRGYLEQTLGRPVALSTAPDIPTFHRRTLAGQYDLVITGPPLAWHAYREAGFAWIAVSDRQLHILFLADADGPIKGLADLRDRTVATIAPMTITSQVAVAALKEQGVEANLRHDKTPFNSVQAVLLGEAAAAAFPDVSLPALADDVRQRLRVIHESPPLPSIAFLVRRQPGLPAPEEVQAALFRFARETEAGRAFVKDFNHDGLHAPDLRAMKILERYLPELKRQLATP